MEDLIKNLTVSFYLNELEADIIEASTTEPGSQPEFMNSAHACGFYEQVLKNAARIDSKATLRGFLKAVERLSVNQGYHLAFGNNDEEGPYFDMPHVPPATIIQRFPRAQRLSLPLEDEDFQRFDTFVSTLVAMQSYDPERMEFFAEVVNAHLDKLPTTKMYLEEDYMFPLPN